MEWLDRERIVRQMLRVNLHQSQYAEAVGTACGVRRVASGVTRTGTPAAWRPRHQAEALGHGESRGNLGMRMYGWVLVQRWGSVCVGVTHPACAYVRP